MERNARRPVLPIVGAILALVAILIVVFTPSPEGDSGAGVSPSSATAPLADARGIVEDVVVPGDASSDEERGDRLMLRVVRWPDGRPIGGAELEVSTDSGAVLSRVHASLAGRLDAHLPAGARSVRVRAEAAGYAPAELTLSLSASTSDVVELALRPTSGWFGRVTSAFGDPVVGAQVVARRYWPPRPALLDVSEEEGVRITSVQAAAPAAAGGVTNTEGFYYVEPFDDQNVVDLVLSVVNDQVASERMHVPLPMPGQELPDLVALAAVPLAGEVLDSQGLPVPGAEVHVDRGPGLDRYVEEVIVADDRGRFRVGRVFSDQHLRAHEESGWFLGARSQGVELPMRDGWATVEPGVPFVSLILDEGGAVAGQILDASTSGPVRDGWAVASSAGEELASGFADGQGRYQLGLPPRWVGQRVRVTVAAPGFENWVRDVLVEARDRVHSLPEYLSPGLGSQLVKGRVFLRETPRRVAQVPPEAREAQQGDPVEGVTVRAWIARRGGPIGDWVLDDGLPEEFTLRWEGQTDAEGRFEFLATANQQDRIVLVSEVPGAQGALLLGRWGPQPLSSALAGVDFLQSYGQQLKVDVGGLDASRRFVVQQTSWNPWTDSSWSGTVPLPGAAVGWESVTIRTAKEGSAFFDVRVDRGPVSAPVASTDGWLDVGELEPLVLEIPEFRSVQGEILRFTAADWPDLCLAFVGPAVPAWRSEWLGESDWCVRPSRNGEFHLSAIPPGDYRLMLYRPVGVEGVEILAERAVTVEGDLSQVEIWAERAADGSYLQVLER